METRFAEMATIALTITKMYLKIQIFILFLTDQNYFI